MKKIISCILVLIIVGGAIFYACKKDNNVEENKEISSIRQQKKPTGAELLAAVVAKEVTLEVGKTYRIQYRTGFYYATEVSILWGAFSYTSTGCNPGDGICDIVHVWEQGGRLVLSPPPVIKPNELGETSIEGLSKPTKECFDGYLLVFPKGVFSDKKIVAFLSDSKQTTYPEWYNSDVFHLKHSFAIEPILCYESHILPKYQIVPAGDYPLYKKGNVCLWYIEIDE
jgi:hypothetical protein